MTSTLKYNLKQFYDVSNEGFTFEIPVDTYNMLNYLSSQVNAKQLTSRIKILSKTNTNAYSSSNTNAYSSSNANTNDKKRWTTTFQTTKLEQKTGIEFDLDQIRLSLNKLTDKTYLDIRHKIIDKISFICENNDSSNTIIFEKIGNMIYDICTTNKFYSKIFVDLFIELVTTFGWINEIFAKKYDTLIEQYNNIKYVDPNKDYDGFCEMNKTNEKRKSITTFYLNLALNGFLKKEEIIKILRNILVMIMDMINNQEYKNEIDELTENVSILFNQELFADVNLNEFDVNGISIIDTVNNLSKCNTKDYLGLSNKTIFKYMDLVDCRL
jgi:hypothetical protein